MKDKIYTNINVGLSLSLLILLLLNRFYLGIRQLSLILCGMSIMQLIEISILFFLEYLEFRKQEREMEDFINEVKSKK